MTLMQRLLKSRKAAAAAVADLGATIDDARTAVADLARQIDVLDRRPGSKADAERLIRDGVAALADRGRVALKLAARKAAGNGAELGVFALAADQDGDVLALLAAACGDALADAMISQMTHTYSSTEQGLNAAERGAERERLEAEMLHAQLIEEGLIRSAEAAGLVIQRRADQHPATILAPDAALPGA